MATLGELKQRVITETNRDDLVDDLATLLSDYFVRAIEYWSDTRFWFNTAKTSFNFVAGSDIQALPSDFLTPDKLYILVGPNRFSICKRTSEDIEMLYSINSTGQPTDFCIDEDGLRVWPKPGVNYAGLWHYIKQLPALTDDSDSNEWTNEAQYLIVATVKRMLYRDVWRDQAGAEWAQVAENEELEKLKAKTNLRLKTGRLRRGW